MSVGLVITAPSLARLNARFAKLVRTFPRQGKDALLKLVGQVVESQTRNRLGKEKAAPDGKPWDDWSEDYAAHKHGRDKSHTPHPGQLRESGSHSLLELSGDLIDSIQRTVVGDSVEVGSNLPYARVQNKARQYLGLSRDNEQELEETIDDFLDSFLGLGGAV